MSMPYKFQQTITDKQADYLQKKADKNQCTIQELIRRLIVVDMQNEESRKAAQEIAKLAAGAFAEFDPQNFRK